jgi:hypothetical protein
MTFNNKFQLRLDFREGKTVDVCIDMACSQLYRVFSYTGCFLSPHLILMLYVLEMYIVQPFKSYWLIYVSPAFTLKMLFASPTECTYVFRMNP